MSLLLALGVFSVLPGRGAAWLDPADPIAGMGVNIHFTQAQPGELEMLSQAGFRWIRIDFTWDSTEKKPGVYDFSAYDGLLANLDKFHLHALFILDYANVLYDQGLAPHTDEGRLGYARWAVAAVTHFKGRGVLWEIWNEPNGHAFWKPVANAEDYAKLALTASKAMKQAQPDESVVGPALSGDEVDFIEASARAGVLNYWAGITIHPYYENAPESYEEAYAMTWALIKKYATPGQNIPVLCGESGYSSCLTGVSESTQAKYLARLLLFDVASGVPLTIWYDWHDDGSSRWEEEHNFGLVRHDYHAGAKEVYDRKPAYDAAQTYARQLTGLRFKGRLASGSSNDFILTFAADAEECIAAWTSSWISHRVTISVPNGAYTVTSYDGRRQSSAQVTDGTISLLLDGGPQYIRRTMESETKIPKASKN